MVFLFYLMFWSVWPEFLKAVSQILMQHERRQHSPVITQRYSRQTRNAGEKATVVTSEWWLLGCGWHPLDAGELA